MGDHDLDERDDDIDAGQRLDATAQRLLNLTFLLNVSPRPVRTDEIIRDQDLGYGSSNRESDLRKFRRDRERLAERGITVAEVRDEDASRTVESSWTIDRAQTFAAGGLVTAEDARLLIDAIDEYRSLHASPLDAPLRSIRRAAIEALGEADDPAPHEVTHEKSHPIAEGIWLAFSLKRSLRFVYQNAQGEQRAHEVALYGLFTHEGISYFVGAELDTTEPAPPIKTFRIDRVEKLEGLGRGYRIPETFSVRDYLFFPFDFAPGESMPVTFSFPAERTSEELEAITYRRGSLTHDEMGRWIWEVDARNVAAAAALALNHARDGMRPQQPEELCRAWNDIIDQVVTLHEH